MEGTPPEWVGSAFSSRWLMFHTNWDGDLYLDPHEAAPLIARGFIQRNDSKSSIKTADGFLDHYVVTPAGKLYAAALRSRS